jgi:hypothetical protein
MSSAARRARACACVAALWGLGAPRLAVAQVSPDSARARILERLQRLSRPPGADSALFVQDSLRREAAQQRPGGPTVGGADSTLAQLRRLTGYAITEYEGGRATFGARERRLVLEASEGEQARVNREGMQVTADTSITFDEGSGRVRTVGASTFTPPDGEAIESRGLVYDLEAARGSAFDASSTYNQGGTRWIVRGDMPFAAPDSSFLSHAIFTSCDLTVPHYHFETDEIKIVAGSVLVARPVRLYFADVPVAWLPFIAQSLSQGRASGLLTPTFSVNDIVRNSTGYRRRISNLGFYWAMSDYSDAMLAIDWFSGTFLALQSGVQYRFNRQFLQGDANFRRYWRENGSTELSLNTQHSWEIDERTQFRVSGSYASSADFVRENSFDPREVTQSIDSQGGLNRRFDWGSVSLSANRRQYLSDDRVEWTLPSANVSLSTITLFRAPSNRAHFWNNMTWGGSANLNRRTVDRGQGLVFDRSNIDTENVSGGLTSNLSLGNLSFNQSLRMEEKTEQGIPDAYLLLGPNAAPADLVTDAPARAVTNRNMSWEMRVGYQQQLIGSTTLTPSVSLSGEMFQSDTSRLASSFVSAPSRMSLGASLKTDLYGFLPGFGGYERIRHKISPSFDYRWSPEVSPTDLQVDVFGTRAISPTRTLAITLNQTLEAKRAAPDSATTGGESVTQGPGAGSGPVGPDTATGPRRMQRPEIVQLLGLRTSVVNYDFVRSDTLGGFLAGFSTMRLSNTITSDFLQGLSVSVDHDLWEDTREDGRLVERKFSPHLSQLNLSFALSSRSAIFRLFGLVGGDQEQTATEEEPEPETDAFDDPLQTGESSIVPGARNRTPAAPRRPRTSGDRSWRANLSYSLQRPRDADAPESQMLNGTVTLRPTDMWDVSWRTSYDLSAGQFNDHTIRLTRDLHRWEAHFDFLQTATGNWQFRFEVALTDNRDLKFDYRQRNLNAGRPDLR